MKGERFRLRQRVVADARRMGIKAAARAHGYTRNTVCKWIRWDVPGCLPTLKGFSWAPKICVDAKQLCDVIRSLVFVAYADELSTTYATRIAAVVSEHLRFCDVDFVGIEWHRVAIRLVLAPFQSYSPSSWQGMAIPRPDRSC